MKYTERNKYLRRKEQDTVEKYGNELTIEKEEL